MVRHTLQVNIHPLAASPAREGSSIICTEVRNAALDMNLSHWQIPTSDGDRRLCAAKTLLSCWEEGGYRLLSANTSVCQCRGLGPAGNKAPHGRSLAPPSRWDGEEKNATKGCEWRQGQGGITHQLRSQANQTRLGEKEINLICYQSNHSRMMRNRAIS